MMNVGSEASKQNVVGIVKQVFGTMLNLQVEEQGEGSRFSSTGAVVMGSICITGGWNGVVILQTTSGLASAMGQAMLQLDEASLSQDDIRDAMGEIINMIGGNLKAQLPGPSALSLPNVVAGTDCSWDVPGGQIFLKLPMICSNELLLVVLIKEAGH